MTKEELNKLSKEELIQQVLFLQKDLIHAREDAKIKISFRDHEIKLLESEVRRLSGSSGEKKLILN